jgi:LysM repeat protein
MGLERIPFQTHSCCSTRNFFPLDIVLIVKVKIHNKEMTMSATSKFRLFSILAVLLILATTLLNPAPVFAKTDGTTPYAVKRGETLTSIAKRFGLTVDKILLANPDLKDPNKLFTGQVIVLPAGRSEGAVVLKDQRVFVWQREKDGGRVERDEHLYLVKSGDSLVGIAKSYAFTLEKLLAANPQIDDPTKLYRGELLHIPDGRGENVPPFYSTPRTPPGE